MDPHHLAPLDVVRHRVEDSFRSVWHRVVVVPPFRLVAGPAPAGTHPLAFRGDCLVALQSGAFHPGGGRRAGARRLPPQACLGELACLSVDRL